MTTESEARRSALMATIKSKSTKPEMIVRRLAHRLGYRFRLHRRDLPGTPDLVFPGRRKVVLVHGCFWHQHDCKLGRKQPSVNRDYWLPKLARNQERDRQGVKALADLGWKSLTVWECQTRDAQALAEALQDFLGDEGGLIVPPRHLSTAD